MMADLYLGNQRAHTSYQHGQRLLELNFAGQLWSGAKSHYTLK
jgi:hypothetical protein